MKKKALYLLAALALGLCVGAASAQVSDERDGYSATAANLTAKTFTYQHTDVLGKISATHNFEIVFGSVPTTASITITPCMVGGTCGTAVSSTSTANQVITIAGMWDYYTVAVTWTGSPPTVFLNITGTHTSLSLRVPPPSSSTAACSAGQYADSQTFHYYCYAANSWVRVAYSSF